MQQDDLNHDKQSAPSLATWMASAVVGESVLYVDCQPSDVSLALARGGRVVKVLSSSIDGLLGIEDLVRSERPEVADRIEWEATGLWDIEPTPFDTLIVGSLDSQISQTRYLSRATDFISPSGRMVFGARIVPEDAFGICSLPRAIVESLGDGFGISNLSFVDDSLRLVLDRLESPLSRADTANLLQGYEKGLASYVSKAFHQRQLLASYRSRVVNLESTAGSQSDRIRQLEDSVLRFKALSDVRQELDSWPGVFSSGVDHLAGIEKSLSDLSENVDLKSKLMQLEAALEESDGKRAEHWDNYRSERAKRAELETQIHEMRRKVEVYEGSTSLAVGRALVRAKSVRGVLQLPGELWRALRIGRARARRSQHLASSAREKSSITPRTTSIVPAAASLDSIGWFEDLDTNHRTVMSIFDEFTQSCFSPHANLIQPRPDNWRSLMDRYSPELVMVESAWRGNEGSWQFRIADYQDPPGRELEELVAEARARSIPTVFWNKEDPVHFENFIGAASLFDVILTTAQESVGDYENRTRARVGVLPFAAEASIHNPIGSGQRVDKVCFAGSYYVNRFQDRAEEMSNLLDAATRFSFDIFDRNYGSGNPDFMFPKRFQAHVRGRLSYEEMNRAYKRYKVFLNVNSVSSSKTMFSRRVFELLACGTPVVSTPSLGIEETFGSDLVWLVETKQQAENAIRTLLEEPEEWRRRSLRGIRAVLRSHTYAHRLRSAMAYVSGSTISASNPNVIVAARVSSSREIESVLRSFERQTIPITERKLFLLSNVKDLEVTAEIEVFSDSDLPEKLERLRDDKSHFTRLALFEPSAAYGKHYLEDLRFALSYSGAEVAAKAASGTDEYAFRSEFAPEAAMYDLNRCAELGTSLSDIVLCVKGRELLDVGGRAFVSDSAEIGLNWGVDRILGSDAAFDRIEIP